MDVASQTVDEAELERQMDTAADTIRAAVLELLQQGDVHPHVLALAAARVTGELAAGAALADGLEPRAVLADVAALVQDAGQGHAEMLAEVVTVAGSA